MLNTKKASLRFYIDDGVLIKDNISLTFHHDFYYIKCSVYSKSMNDVFNVYYYPQKGDQLVTNCSYINLSEDNEKRILDDLKKYNEQHSEACSKYLANPL